MIVAYLFKLWCTLAAKSFSELGAAVCKSASLADINGIGDISLKEDPVGLLQRMLLGLCGNKGFGVRMKHICVKLLSRSHLNYYSQIYDRHRVAQSAHYRKVMRNEQYGLSKLISAIRLSICA